MTNTSESVCVLSCKNLVPTAYIKGTMCVRSCGKDENNKVLFIDFSSKDAPKCSDSCPLGFYKESLTNSDLPTCVNSCKNLIPTAYINKAGDTCTRSCEAGEVIDKTDSDKPKCTDTCPSAA